MLAPELFSIFVTILQPMRLRLHMCTAKSLRRQENTMTSHFRTCSWFVQTCMFVRAHPMYNSSGPEGHFWLSNASAACVLHAILQQLSKDVHQLGTGAGCVHCV
jgi:hypothetical protein